MIHGVVANKVFENSLVKDSADEKKLLNRMQVYNARKSPDIYLAVTSTTASGIREILNLIGNQATAALIRHPKTKLTDVCFVAPDEKTTLSAPTT